MDMNKFVFLAKLHGYDVFDDGFEDKQDVIDQFDAPHDALDGAVVLYATYTYEDYSGDAFVLYWKDGQLYEVNGGHCSCYGLEGQWDPEVTTEEALIHRIKQGRLGMSYDDADVFGQKLLDMLVNEA